MSTDSDINRIRDHIVEMEHEGQRLLTAQKLAAGDDTDYFRTSLVEFCMWDHGCTHTDATERVDGYLDEYKGERRPRRFRRRKRKV